MTEQEILAAAEKAFSQHGIVPVQLTWSKLVKTDGGYCVGMCLLTAVVGDLGVASSKYTQFLGVDALWLKGCLNGWDGISPFDESEEYKRGYEFGVMARKKFIGR